MRKAMLLTWLPLFAGMAGLLLAVPAGGADIEPDVDSLIRKSCTTIAQAEALTFSADITYEEVSASGDRVSQTGRVDTSLQRDGGIRTAYSGAGGDQSFWYDGDRVTVMDPKSPFYATEKAPATNDETLEYVHDRLDFSLPLEDFLYSDPYAGLVAGVKEGSYVGREDVMGVSCHRLALVQDDIDWEIWIEDSDRPVPRKLTITYKNLPGRPTYSAVISNWNFTPDLSRRFFIFEPPLGTERVEFLPASEETPKGGAEK